MNHRQMDLSLILRLTIVLCLASANFTYAQDINQVLQRWKVQEQTELSLQRSLQLEEVNRAFERVDAFWAQMAHSVGNETSQNVSQECQDGMLYLLEHQDDFNLPLLVDMIDAIGKPPAGLLEGNIFASGAYDECFAIEHTEYCSGFVSLPTDTSFPLGWLFGMCVPEGCDATDIMFVINSTEILKANLSTISCESSQKPPYNTGAIIMIIVCFIFAFLVCVGTILDWMAKLWKKKTLVRLFRTQTRDPELESNDSVNDSEKTPLLNLSPPKEKTTLFTFIEAFSLYRNLPTILSTDQPPSAITSLNGLRVLSMFWIIISHNHFAVRMIVDNGLVLKDVMSRFSFQAIGNAYYAVDTFFFLSGLLVAYLTLRQMARKKGRFPFIAYYLHRYLRLTPAYAFVIFFVMLLTMHLADGPSYAQLTWVGSDLYENCAKYWWTNLLYINNLYPWKIQDECLSWTWYLANDMQFFVTAPLIIIPMYFLLPIGLAVSSLLLLVSFITSGVLTGVYNLQPNEYAEMAYNFTADGPNSNNDLLYVRPWHRIPPYIVGLLIGYLFHYKVRVPFTRVFNLIVYISAWILAAVILFSCLYGLYFTWHGHTPTIAENVLYNSFSRFAWAVGLALIIFACHNGYGGAINSFLSMRFWIPLSRLTYNAYLVHPMILFVFYGSERKPVHYGDINLAVYAMGTLVLSYGAAALVSVFVEFPLGNVEQAIFKLVGLGGRESTRRGTRVKTSTKTDQTK